MNTPKRALHAADKLQQQHAWLAVPVAVWKKFGDDQAGNLAALIAYYAFVAIFPLHLRRRARPARLAVPAGGADPVRGRD